MDISTVKQKCKGQTEQLFKEKILSVIQPEAILLTNARVIRQNIEREIETYQQKLEAAMVAAREIQGVVDKLILDGADTKKGLRELEIKKAELTAFEGHLERLAAQHEAAVEDEKKDTKGLEEALRRALLDLRPDIEDLTRSALTEALAGLIYFEEFGITVCKDHDAELGMDFAKDAFRFLSLDPLLKELSAFLSPVGRGESLGRRTKIRHEFLAVELK